jgi:hypothetical protein
VRHDELGIPWRNLSVLGVCFVLLWRLLMSIFWERRDELEKYEFMMGETRGRLAVTLDALTDALILVGQHGVYCSSARNPAVPALDLQAVTAHITGAKELVSSVMEKLRLEKEAAE